MEEIRTAKLILKTLGLRRGGIEVVSCPTCGRTKIDLIGLANEVEKWWLTFRWISKWRSWLCGKWPRRGERGGHRIAGGIAKAFSSKGTDRKEGKEEELLSTLRQELLDWKQ